MISYKDFKKIFEEKEEIIGFFDGITKQLGDFQIKGMKQVLLRKKAVPQVVEN